MTFSIRGKIISPRHSAFDIFENKRKSTDSVIEVRDGTILEAFQMCVLLQICEESLSKASFRAPDAALY